jgi:hypothetical protein
MTEWRAITPARAEMAEVTIMSARLVHMKTKAENAADLETAFKNVSAALADATPQGIRYSTYKLSDGTTFVVMLELEDGVENPLPTIPAFRELQEGLKSWLAEPVAAEPLTVVGDYRA